MSTFALIHGAWHGAWCWDRLTPELASRGHRAITVDLPCDDGSATFEDYADVVCAAIAEDDVVLVGHSLGGLTVARVAARRALRHLVYLCGVPPAPGQAFAHQMSENADMLLPDYLNGISGRDDEGRTRWIDQGVAARVLFDDCDEASAAAAFARLRPQGTRGYKVPFEPSTYPDVDTTSVICAGDRMVNPDWSRRIARDRLGANVIEMPGGHSPFLSRPGHLADVLHALTSRVE